MSAPPTDTPRAGRLAPSPTGLLHLGHARTFLLAWAHLRSLGARVLLRLEDLDTTRVKPGMADACLEDLAWLGLDWDDEPRSQSDGIADLEHAVAELVERGLAYPCVCTRREVQEAASAPHGGNGPYPGTCRGRFASLEEARAETGREAALRFTTRAGLVGFEDGIQGTFVNAPGEEVGDFPITSRDGQVAYQLAVVVDDARSGVTDVHRGSDLLDSTTQQLQLQRALKLAEPRYWHLPLVLDGEGRRLAKRADDLSLRAIREAGTAPEVLVAWAAGSVGLVGADGPPMAAEELVAGFDVSRVRPDDTRLAPGDLERFGLA